MGIAQLILILFSDGIFHVLLEVASLCSLNDTRFGEELVLFKDKCIASVSSYREKLFRVRGFSEENK